MNKIVFTELDVIAEFTLSAANVPAMTKDGRYT
jgi:hypothetical protein